jgi:serine/threonine protein kinase/tetratricopeptide (TPR) repeat protein
LTPVPPGDTRDGPAEVDNQGTVNAEEGKRIHALVDAARHRDPEERESFLNAACAGRPSLRAAVASMLRAHADADDSAAAGQTRQPTRPASDSADGSSAASLTMLRPGQTLGPRYHIIRLLGVGGMGAVYHAWDAELGVAVALKVIRPDMTADPEAAALVEQRFKRELLLARQVTHKHVVRIHDLGDVDGIKYITMPYVRGADLATVLRQAGRLPVQRALAYTRHIVDGLVAAHEAGVVHRDLKPANIMIDDHDQALIMDFGIARSADGSGGTVAGRVVGTLAYMAPEQAQGKPTDQRADVYALGMMLSEMLVGRRGAGPTEQDALTDLVQRMREAPPRVRTNDPTIPEPLDDIIARCLEPDPAKRFQTSTELAAALGELDENGHRIAPATPVAQKPAPSRWRLVAMAAMALAVIGITAILFLKRPSQSATSKPVEPLSILVADFENKTGDPVFDGALEQPLTIAMEGASFVTSYSRRDALKVAEAQRLGNVPARLDAQTAQLVAFRQGIKYVLAGSVSMRGGKFALELAAVDPVGGKAIRSAAASAATKGEVLSAVGSLAAKVRTGLGDKTPESAKRAALETFTAGSLDAMREYSLAQDLQNAGRNEEALAHYRRAIELDPKFGRAYSGAANATYRLGRREEADALWKQALALMDRMTDREKYRTLGAYNLGIAGNYEQAKDNYSALVNAYPFDSAGHANLAFAYFYLHDFTKTAQEGQRAIDLDPTNFIAKSNQTLYAMYAGDFSGAAAIAAKVVAQNPSVYKAYLPVAVDAVAQGDMPAAAKAYDRMLRAGAAGASLASSGRADLALYTGRLDAAVVELKAGIAADVAAKITTGAALKQVALAEGELAAGRRPTAIDAAHEALKLSRQLATIVPAARVLLRAGKGGEARALAAELEGQLQKQNRAYAKIVLAEIALEDRKVAEASDLLTQARDLSDLWLGRFDLGVAYVQAAHFAEAMSELDACEKRRGEATALFFDDVPTVRYLATLPYWIGRAQEGLGMGGPSKTRYEAFLKLRTDAKGDPLVEDVRRRLAGGR